MEYYYKHMRTENDIIASAFHWDFMILYFLAFPAWKIKVKMVLQYIPLKNIPFLLQRLQGFNFFSFFLFSVYGKAF